MTLIFLYLYFLNLFVGYRTINIYVQPQQIHLSFGGKLKLLVILYIVSTENVTYMCYVQQKQVKWS